jgi:hypothetical protein
MRHSYEIGRSICILLGVSVAAIAFGLTASPAGAEAIHAVSAFGDAQSAPAAGKTADNLTNNYFFEFRGRSAAQYGHMYVLFGKVNARGEIVESDIAGLHPAGDANDCDNCSIANWTLGHVMFVPSETGASDGDLEEKYVTARYRVMVDQAHYEKTVAYIRKLQAKNPLWHAVLRNCVSFGRDIAIFMGLQVPPTSWQEPKTFVTGLRELNGGGEQLPLVDAPVVDPSAPVSSNAEKPKKLGAQQKQKKPHVSKLPSSQAAGITSGTVR